MSDVTGSKDFVAFGGQKQRPPDVQPERLLMRAPDGRTVHVMAEDVADFEVQGFVLAAAAVPETEPEQARKPRRQKVTQPEPEETR